MGYNTPLHFAVIHENLRMIEYLCKQPDIQMTEKNALGQTPADIATLIPKKRMSQKISDYINKKLMNSNNFSLLAKTRIDSFVGGIQNQMKNFQFEEQDDMATDLANPFDFQSKNPQQVFESIDRTSTRSFFRKHTRKMTENISSHMEQEIGKIITQLGLNKDSSPSIRKDIAPSSKISEVASEYQQQHLMQP